MTNLDWEHTDHFTITENWGDPYKMNLGFVRELSRFREFIKMPIIITYGTQGRHEDGSLHYKGLAVDCVIPDEPLLDAFINACRFNFTGIGYYPKRRYADKVMGGLHLEQDPFTTTRKFWIGVPDEDGVNHYYGMNASNIREFS